MESNLWQSYACQFITNIETVLYAASSFSVLSLVPPLTFSQKTSPFTIHVSLCVNVIQAASSDVFLRTQK